MPKTLTDIERLQKQYDELKTQHERLEFKIQYERPMIELLNEFGLYGKDGVALKDVLEEVKRQAISERFKFGIF